MNIFLHMIEKSSSTEDVNTQTHHEPEIVTYAHDENTSEGSEFLDDAIRMTEQPLQGLD